ncbi:DUF1740-domain-containing protein [Xylariaceae sp. FL0255]|nr:DUF1740-domain-containing protein [Xylariaceae sp. FL0255]
MSNFEDQKRKKPTVPKFTSFKRPKSPTRLPNESSRSDAPPVPSRASPPIGISHTSRNTGDQNALYAIDKRGDALIRRYGGNDPRTVPPYRRFGSGRILGNDGFMRIERIGTREEFFIATYHDSRSLLSSDKKNLLAKGFRPTSKSVRVRRKASVHDDASHDYLSLGSSKKRKRGQDAAEALSDDDTPNYRSIHGKSKPRDDCDSDDLDDSDERSDEIDREERDPATLRSIELARKAREHPEDIDVWLELVTHQDALLQIQCGARIPTAAETRSFADIKLSLLQQALSHVVDDALRERLHLRIILEGLKVWEHKTALKRFAEVMQKYPKSFELWKLYATFQQTSLSTFAYDEIKQLYTGKLHTLVTEYQGLQLIPDQVRCCEQLICVFLKMTRFIADAGFMDLATAAWQALLELTFARPTSLPPPPWVIPSGFKEFWENEAPRLGEVAWQGWASSLNGSDDQGPPDPKPSSTASAPSTRDGFRAWYTVEHQKALNATIPARTLDDGAEDDPFRVVLFADIEQLLLYFPAEIIPYIKCQILAAFLMFCDLPPALNSGTLMKEYLQDPLLVRVPTFTSFIKVEVDERGRKKLDFSHVLHQMQPTTEVLFPSRQWFTYLSEMRSQIPPDRYHWISTTLKQLTRTLDVSELGPYYFAFESINEPGNEKKNAKALLKRDHSNADLYLGYATIENEKGNEAAARNVLSAALGLPSFSTDDRTRLGIGAAWLELTNGNLGRAAVLLCKLAEDGSQPRQGIQLLGDVLEVSSSQILKARHFFTTNCDYNTSSSHISQAIIYAEGLMLLEYFTGRNEKEPRSVKQGDILSAVSTISQFSGDLVARGHARNSAHEVFLQGAARLLYYHASHGPLRPSLLREQLMTYLGYVPSNTIFLHLFAWREERLSIDDRVRSLLQDQILQSHDNTTPLSTHIFAITHEQRVGTAHSTRVAFERALLSPSGIHNPSLWISYIRFCHSQKELRRDAKNVFYRAIQSCPWSRDVYLEAFATLVRDMDSAELKSVYSTMTQKGLRVFVELEGFVEKWRKEAKGIEERERDKREGRANKGRVKEKDRGKDRRVVSSEKRKR